MTGIYLKKTNLKFICWRAALRIFTHAVMASGGAAENSQQQRAGL